MSYFPVKQPVMSMAYIQRIESLIKSIDELFGIIAGNAAFDTNVKNVEVNKIDTGVSDGQTKVRKKGSVWAIRMVSVHRNSQFFVCNDRDSCRDHFLMMQESNIVHHDNSPIYFK